MWFSVSGYLKTCKSIKISTSKTWPQNNTFSADRLEKVITKGTRSMLSIKSYLFEYFKDIELVNTIYKNKRKFCVKYRPFKLLKTISHSKIASSNWKPYQEKCSKIFITNSDSLKLFFLSVLVSSFLKSNSKIFIKF